MSDKGVIKRVLCVPARAELLECRNMTTKLREGLPGFACEMNRLSERLAPFLSWLEQSPYAEMPLVKLGRKLVPAFLDNFVPILQSTFDELDEIPASVKEAVELLADEGWFFDPAMPLDDLCRFGERISSEGKGKADSGLAAYFEANILEIEQGLTVLYPKRKMVLSQAFDAHRNGSYALSVPVLLAQADGICKEMAGGCIFLKEKGKPRTANYVSKINSDTFDYIFHGPLAKSLPISASGNDVGNNNDTLNRHTVMHGVSLDYGTNINSLKSISLINYVGTILNWKNVPQDAE